MAAAAPKPPAPASRRNNIGTLRLAGALAVLFGHAFVLSSTGGRGHDPVSDALNDVTPFHLGLPGLGVAMFFAVSGYLVTQSYVRRGSVVAYAEARLLRIYPALWLAIGLTIAVSALISTFPPGDFLSARPTVGYAIGGASLLDVHYFLPGVFTDNPRGAVNGSLWTLPVELRMYLFVGIAGVIGMLGRRMLFNIAVVTTVALAAIWPEHMPLLAHHEQLEISTFFLAGAVLFVNRESVPLTGVGVIALAALTAALSWTAAFSLIFALTFSYAVMWLGLTSPVRLPDLAARGDLSYGTYLFAFPVTQLWVAALGPGKPLVVAALSAAVCLPLAFASWRAVEAPALRLKGRLSAITDRRVSYSRPGREAR